MLNFVPLRHTFLFLLFSFCNLFLFAQISNQLTHYSVADGLPQNRVSGIYEDRTGFIWIPTHDGLARYDGENFNNYLNALSGGTTVKDSRLDQLMEDRFGNIWAKSNLGQIYRLNTSTNSIDIISNLIEQNYPGFETTSMTKVSSGAIWLSSSKMGCFCFDDSLLNFEYYGTKNSKLSNDTIRLIQNDDDGNTWIVTAGNLSLFKRVHKHSPTLLECFQIFDGNFRSLLELDDRVLLGTQSGLILNYWKLDGKFDTLNIQTSYPVSYFRNDRNKQVVIGTEGDGFFIYHIKTEKTEHYNTKNSELLNDHIVSFHFDPQGDIWIQTMISGVARFDHEQKKIIQYHPPISDINKHLGGAMIFRIDRKGNTFIRPRDGILSYYDPITKQLIPFNKSRFSPSPDYSPDIFNFDFDRQNNLWISPVNKGVDKITFSNNNINIHRFNSNINSAENNIRAILEVSNGNIWVSSRDGKIRVIDRENNLKGYLCSNGTIGYGIPLKGVAYCLFEDEKQNIWIGTRGEGLYIIPTNGTKNEILHFTNDPNDIYSLNNDNIYSINSDKKGRIWIGTWGDGLNLCTYLKDGSIHFINHRNKLKNYPIIKAAYIRHISEEKAGKIYIASNRGLVVFDSDFQSEDQIRYHFYGQGDIQSGTLSQGDIQHIYHASNGKTYLSTGGGGINFVKEWTQDAFPKSFGLITQNDGLSSNYILSIIEDSFHMLWVFSENSITRYDPLLNSFHVFPSNKIIPSGIYSEGSTILSKSLKIIKGSSEGLLSFEPLKITTDTYSPSIVLTNFLIFNNIVPVGGTKYYRKHIDKVNQLTLTPKDKIFSIEFSALDFRSPRNIHYAYKLDGFDDDWRHSKDQSRATYMNLPKGKYVLRIKSTNASGTWVENERQLQIEMLPTFWQSAWGHLAIILGAILLIVGGAYILFVIYRLRHRVRVEAHIAELKLRFFTDISHEIRTPLTLIIGPVEHLLSQATTPTNIKKQLNIVRDNAQRTLSMVNQILDFRRAQHGRLKIEQFVVGDFVKSACKNFESLAKEKHIRFTVQDLTNGNVIWADKNGFEKILFNLLTNAFKYTPDGKGVQVKIVHDSNGITLKVIDQGIGIDTKNIPRIFDRFYTVKSHESRSSSGIGLSMVKELVDKHKGQISVESVPNEGTTFTILFKDGYTHFDKQSDLIIKTMPETTDGAEKKQKTLHNQPNNENLDKPTVLVVEDDSDLRNFMLSMLSPDYQVVLAENGIEGHNMALRHIPDFIVSDLMMPEMDGMDLLKELRSNINTSHIPFILLTAKDNIEDKIRGMDTGADDYIVKPFSVTYFQARIQNLLIQRKNLQYRYSSELFSSLGKYEKINNKCMADLDQDFLDSIVRQIESRLDDSEYSVETMAKSTGINRTAFFKKVKSLTGMAPLEFIRDIRIQNAARMLEDEKLLVKDICYRVGFSDQKYFTRCFKAKYKVSPTDYRTNLKRPSD